MNEAFKEENIEAFLAQNGYTPPYRYIYALVNPSELVFLALSVAASFLTDHYILAFLPDGIALISLDLKGDFTGAQSFVPLSQLSGFSYKKGLMQGTLRMQSGENKVKFKVPNAIVVAKWQKPNLEWLVAHGWQVS